MTKFKFLSLALMSVMAVAMVSSCDKDDKNKDDTQSSSISVITAVVETGGDTYNDKIDAVRAFGYYSLDRSSSHDYVVASAKYENDGFTLNLPSTVDAQYLGNIKFTLDIPDNITISDTTTKVISVYGIDPYKNGNPLSSSTERYALIYCKDPDNKDTYTSTEFVYLDRDVTITGTSSDNSNGVPGKATYSVSLKQGWNKMYSTGTTYSKAQETGTSTLVVTTTEPSGWKWYLIYNP